MPSFRDVKPHSLQSWSGLKISDWVMFSDDSPFQLKVDELKIKRGEVLGIVGRSGAGKSLFIKSLFGILPSGYQFGENAVIEVTYGDRQVLKLDAPSMSEEDWQNWRTGFAGYLPQDPIPSLDPIRKLKYQLQYCFDARSIPFEENRIYDTYKDLEINKHNGFLEKYPHELSGGEAQRMVFMMASIGQPSLLVADEPTASLDSELVEIAGKMIREWSADNNRSAIVSSHDLKFISAITDAVAFIDEGSIVESGRSDLVLERPGSRTGNILKESVITNQQGYRSFQDRPAETVHVRLDQVSKSYGKKVKSPALREISISIDQSSRLGIWGKSGSGKSTLAKIVSGILEPSTGIVSVNNITIDYKDPRRFGKLSREVQYIAQDPFSAFSPRLSVGQSVIEVMKKHHKDSKSHELSDVLKSWMDKCGLEEWLAERYPSALSGGEKQRFAFLRAMACKPKLVILDEVTAALDHISRKRVLDMILKMSDENNFSYWVISHDKEVIDYMCDKVIHLADGQIK